MNEQTDLRRSCRAFVAAAFDALREEHVIPTPIFHPYVAVGRDYFGDTVRAVAEYHTHETDFRRSMRRMRTRGTGPHRALQLVPPGGGDAIPVNHTRGASALRRLDLGGGLIHEYGQAA